MEDEQVPGWLADPTGRHHQRYWDGQAWTDQVADSAGAVTTDPISATPTVTTPAVATAAPTPPASGRRSKVLLALVVLILVIAAAVGGAVVAGGGDDDDVATDEATFDRDEGTTTTEQETTTTTERVTTTTEPELEDPTSVVGSDIAVALGDLSDAGFEVEQVEVIDETVPDGEVTAVEEQADGTVLLTVARPPVTRFLEQLRPAQGSVEGPTFNISGTTYSHGISDVAVNDEGSAFEYDLGRDFRRFQATVGILDNATSVSRVRVEISLDGAIVSTTDLGFGETLPVDLDVTNVLRLRVALVALETGGSFPAVGFGDGRLLGVPSEVPPLPPGG